MSIFTSKKVWKFLIKIQLTKSDPKRIGDGKCPPSCQLGLIQTWPSSWYELKRVRFTASKSIYFSYILKDSYTDFWWNKPYRIKILVLMQVRKLSLDTNKPLKFQYTYVVSDYESNLNFLSRLKKMDWFSRVTGGWL